jgi:hypothetical protein
MLLRRRLKRPPRQALAKYVKPRLAAIEQTTIDPGGSRTETERAVYRLRLARPAPRIYTVNPYSIGVAMKWRVRLMREAGRRIPWKILVNDLGRTGHIRTHRRSFPGQESYKVAQLIGSGPLPDTGRAVGELINPELVDMGENFVILRGYERLKDANGHFTVLQEWRCEPA